MAAIIYESVTILGLHIGCRVGEFYESDGMCVAIGVNPVPPLPLIAVVMEFGESAEAKQGDPANHKRIYMVSPQNIVAEARVEDGPAPVEIVKAGAPPFIVPGQ